VESIGLAPAVALGLALLGAAKVGEQLEGWAPLLELHLPVQHDRCGDHDQVGTPITPAQAISLQHESSGDPNHPCTGKFPSAYIKQEQRAQGRGGV